MSAPVAEIHDALRDLANERTEGIHLCEMRLRAVSLENIKLISEAVAQSVARKHGERSVGKALQNTSSDVHALEKREALIPSSSNIMRTVGSTFAVREAVLAKLEFFDAGTEVRSDERLARLQALLADHFAIKKRMRILQEKMTYLSEMNQILMDLLQNRKSHRLE